MDLIVKCWKSKNGKLCKGLFYETEKGRYLLTFDKWAIISLLDGYNKYRDLKEGDEISYSIYYESEVNIK